MVNFSVFNELSLPLDAYTAQEKFGIFFELLKCLANQNLNKIRMTDDFKNFDIVAGVTFQQFLGQQLDKDFSRRLSSFATNQMMQIDTPIIQTDDIQQVEGQHSNEYFYENTPTDGGLACCDIWNTIAVSFDSDVKWNKSNIDIEKTQLNKFAQITKETIQIKHASKIHHLQSHTEFFNDFQQEINQKITRENLWDNRIKFFPNTIVFCPEIEQQVKKLDKQIFNNAISILRDIEMERKVIDDFINSPESESTLQNPKLKNQRMFSVKGVKTLFSNHIKSLPNENRIYFIKKQSCIQIGYIGKHLSTAKYK